MLQKLHERIKGWVATVIILVISATFVLWGVQYYLQGANADSAVVAKVNRYKITQKQLAVTTQQLQHQYMMSLGRVLTDAESQQIKQVALQDLILRSVLLQSAQQAGFRTSTEQVDALITSMPQFQENGQFSAARYQQLLYANSLTPYAFLNNLMEELTIRQVEMGIEDSAFVLPDEVQSAYVLANQQRSFSYVVVPQARFMNTVKITDLMLNNYYQQHRDEFKSPEKVSVDYLEVTPQHINASVDEAQINQYYQDHLANYQAQKKNFSAVKTEIKKILLQQKINNVLTKQTDQLSDIAYTNPTSLVPAAQALHLPIQTTPLFTREGASTGIAADPKVVAAAFSDDVLMQGNNSDLIQRKDGSVIILRIKQHELSQLLSLAAVKSQIEKILRQQLAQAQAAIIADKIEASINNQTLLTQLTHEYQLTWQQKTNILNNNKSIASPIMASAFSLKKNQAATTTVLANGDSVVVQLHGIKMGDAKQASAKDLQALQHDLLVNTGRTEYQLYVLSAQQHAKIKINTPAKK